jgi:CheY-like chemotaxis protein
MMPSSRNDSSSSVANASRFGAANGIPHPDLCRPALLVVGDQAAVRGSLHAGLQHYGFVVWQAADGPEALRVYQQHGSQIDLVLLDVDIPGLDGPQTLAALLQINPQLRSCFVTGEASRDREDELLKLGARCVLEVPVPLAILAHVLARILGREPARVSPGTL